MPDPARIQGPQILKKREPKPQKQDAKGKRRAAPKPVGEYPCKHTFCTKLHYTTPGGANRHMREKHSQDNLSPYPPLLTRRKRHKQAGATSPV